MKHNNLKITPISLALLGGLSLVPTAAQAAKGIEITKTPTTEENTRVFTYTANNTDPSEHLTKDKYKVFNIYKPEKVIFNIDDPNLEFDKTLNLGHTYGALGINAFVSPTIKSPVEVEFNLKNFKSITTENISETEAVFLRTQGIKRKSTQSNVNSKTTVTGDQTRIISATANNINASPDQIKIPCVLAFSNLYWTPGDHQVLFDAPNTTYKTRAINTKTPYHLIGISQGIQHHNNSVNLEFRGGIVDVQADPNEHSYGATGISIGASNHRGDSYPEDQVKASHLNLTFSDGSITSSGAKSTVGILTHVDSDYYANSNITINGGTINATAGQDGMEVGGAYIKVESKKSLPELVGKYSTITQNGGEINIDASGIKEGSKISSWVYGLSIYQTKESGLNALITQNAGTITVSNTKESSSLGSGIASYNTLQAEIKQGEAGKVTVNGTNNAAFFASSWDADTIVDIAGYGQANDYGIYTQTQAGKLSTINIRDTARLFADTAVVNNEGDSLITVAQGATIGKADQKTKFDLDEGNDKLIFNGTNLEYITELDGGQDSNVETDFDTLVFNDYTDLDLGNRLKNWERVELNNGSYRLTSDVNVGVGANSVDNSKVGGVVINANSTLHINNDPATGRLVIDGDLHNQGVLDLRDSNPDSFTKLTVNNDYYGGGLIKINAKLAGDDSATDSLAINSDVYGKTKVEVTNVGDASSARDTVDGIKLIRIANGSTLEAGAESFQLLAPVEAGAYEYNTLSYLDTNGKKGFYLQSKSTIATDERNSGSILINGKEAQLRKDAIGYALNQQINAQALADLNSGLHHRSGEQRAETNYLNKNQSWVRYLGNSNDLTVSYLGAKTSSFGLQVGYDFRTTHNQDNRSRTGVALAYNKLDSKLKDDSRKDQVLPGKVSTDLSSLALYHTGSFGNAYFDLVGGLHFLHSDYAVVNGGQQNAFGGNLSLEGGYNLDLGNNFFVEPQVQLAYQGTRYADFKDATSEIKGYTHQSLRPRLGLRLGYHDVKGTNLWLHANLETEVLKTAKLTIGNDLVSVDRAGKYLYDLGLNGQVALSPTTVLYGSAQYKGSFDKKTTLSTGEKVKATKLKGFGGELGLRFTW